MKNFLDANPSIETDAGHAPATLIGSPDAAQTKDKKRHWYSITAKSSSTSQDKDDVEKGTYEYKNKFGETSKYESHDVETYLSTTRYSPRKLVVQASEHNVNKDGLEDWERRKVTGSVPTALRLSEWTLRPAFPKRRGTGRVRWIGIPSFIGRTLLVAFPLQLYMSLPIFTSPLDEDVAEDTYLDWPGYHWKWPKFAVNPLDMAPGSADAAQRVLSAVPRLLRPRLLMVRDGDQWVRKDMDADPDAEIPYVMISYANRHFHTDVGPQGQPAWAEGQEQLRRIAKYHAEQLGVPAYWMDFECRAGKDDPQLLDADVNRFCDVVRGSHRVVIALPDNNVQTALEWGNRMWTLPEGLLAPGKEIPFHYVDTDTVTVRTKIEMANLTWRSTNKPRDGQDSQATRLLAEHFVGTVTLSRLQLMATSLVALWDRKAAERDEHLAGELAHALMGLLHTRIDPIAGNTLFQDIAKLSLLNDSDRLVERMLCLSTANDISTGDDAADYASNTDPFRMLQHADDFGTHLWDMKPTCEVVGIDEQDRTVILNDCRAIAIRWKAFPKILYKRSTSWKKWAAELFLRSGAWWIITGITLAYTYAPIWNIYAMNASSNPGKTSNILLWAVLFFLAMGILLSALGPLSLRILYGGVLLQPAPHLIAFEGTMPIDELEKVVFGNYDGRLEYEPSSTPFSKDHRHPIERAGEEPDWVRKGDAPPGGLKSGHRLFTLVDTGNLSISIFQAERPPTVALICGREGGMLRTVLCSWKSSADCLYKEAVVRMPTETYEMASPKGWLKLQLGRPQEAARQRKPMTRRRSSWLPFHK